MAEGAHRSIQRCASPPFGSRHTATRRARHHQAALAVGLLLSVVLLVGCSATSIVNALTPRSGYEVHRDLSYGPAERHRLDVYVPDGAANAPVVLYFYGGRWQWGSKSQYRFVGQAFTSRGMVIAIADYRVFPQVKFPGFVEDGADALVWVHRNIVEFGGNPERIFVAGHSAGAHIAALLNLDERYLAAVGADRSWLAGMIGLAGPYDFLPFTDDDLKDIFGPPERFAESQPINFVDGSEPPMLLLQGLEDRTVWPRNARNLARAIEEKQGSVQAIFYEDLEHLRIVGALAAPLRRFGPVLADISTFVSAESERR